MATLDQAISQMLAAGLPPLPPGGPVIDGRIHRYGPKKKAWYVLHEFATRAGRRLVFGAFGIWSGAENNAQKITTELEGIDPEEAARLQRSQAEQQAREDAKRNERARFAANRARAQWNAARAGGASPYLERKGVQPVKGLRYFADGTLVVPMVRYDVDENLERNPDYTGPRRLVGLQKIAPDGTKLFNKGMLKVGACCRLGSKPKDGELILIGEGIATVLSALTAVEHKHPAFVAFDAGNLLPAARIVRGLYPRSALLFLADDDAYLAGQLNKRLRDDYDVAELHAVDAGERTYATRQGEITVRADLHQDARGTEVLTAGVRRGDQVRTLILTNAGRTKAWEAAGELGNAWVCWPKFVERPLPPDPDAPRRTDFNDLHAAEGLDAVREQLAQAIAAIHSARELAQALAAGTPPPPTKPPAGAGQGAGDDEPDWSLHSALLKRFTLVYPSDTAYDAQLGRLVRLEHMRNLFGRKPVSMWQGSPRKRMVTSDQVVFDPLEISDPKTTVNLFTGLKIRPKANAACESLIKLLEYLCGEEDRDQAPVTEWVLRWIAYPLQHVGAKMQTAVVMYGEEGTGKNLFWGAVRSIYGDYGGFITQQQLNSQFNGWLSAKLFILANEVVTRQEMRHHVGLLKHLVTEPEIWINRKQLDERRESNHTNLVFLSNELQPLQISPRDRRYMVIRTPSQVKPREYYRKLGAQVRAGGAEALYAYLLDLDLADFDEHTKPLFTDAKADLIEIGMSASQLFWQDLHDGLLGLPYCPALSTDVYQAFLAWCRRNGEKMPARINRWLPEFMSLNGVRRRRLRIPDPDRASALRLVDEDGLRQRQVLLMGEQTPDEAAEHRRIVDGVCEFREKMRDYLTEDRALYKQSQWGEAS